MNYEKYAKYMEERKRVFAENNRLLLEKMKEVEEYIATNYISCGLVHTNYDRDFKEQRFYMWHESGTSVTHKYITFASCGIAPLVLLPYPEYK